MEGHTMSEPVVYVVDDDESVCRALARLIRSVGLPVETFQSAKDFLAHEAADRPACLVLDMLLPGASGLDLQSTLTQAGRDIPIVFITGHGDVPMAVKAMKAGAVDFLAKPFTEATLLAAIARAFPGDASRADFREPEGVRPVA